jgi:formate hydrogenlyase subunit 3/multisubunit Na+/H+ antiporter MnhD subunit
MNTILYSILILLVSGAASFLFKNSPRLSNLSGALGAFAGSAAGLAGVYDSCTNRVPLILNLAWKVPLAGFSIKIDALSAFFLFIIYLSGVLGALYGHEYLKHYYKHKNIGSCWFFYNLLIASMALVTISSNAILFLTAWELMSVSSFFLVLFEGEKLQTAKAGYIYLTATHVATLFLLVMFIILAQQSNSFDFASWSSAHLTGLSPVALGIIFFCGLIGFGTKAGIMPLHIWLPQAHPAAPSHVSALMSGVMIKIGVYGLLRLTTFLGSPQPYWGYALIVSGAVSAALGILFALAQHDIKRALAYSSIENMGIIFMGLGIGFLGTALNSPALAVSGFAGALFHIFNHSLFKGLLFFGAGVVFQQTGTREIDLTGGLAKKMPLTAIFFLIASAAICGLPPLNGFIGEFLIYRASFFSITVKTQTLLTGFFITGALALAGALAMVCFTKSYGIIFSGEPRSNCTANSHDPGLLSKISMGTSAFLCILSGLLSFRFIHFFKGLLKNITPFPENIVANELSLISNSLYWISLMGCILAAGCTGLLLIRHMLLKDRKIAAAPTWDCAYHRPGPNMQYTSSSFVQPVADFFNGFINLNKTITLDKKYFPDKASFKSKAPDIFTEKIFKPLVKLIHRATASLTWFQHGKLQSYILYILFTLIALLIWKI